MIKIYEKDVLFCGIIALTFFSSCMYILLDFLADSLQVIVAADPTYANLEVGFALIRIAAWSCMIVIAGIFLFFIGWQFYKTWKEGRKAYWRDNL